ncbi:hypothetical protein QNH28_15085 [Paenibacillus sp. G2S3]|uniref:hypothetical protein n=1 Tax=Paenibacillus sp. G2S3 TaxID=3047872 RepID=UPI0024C101CF|nr:hypothetical protein [Paenibacillus sp. G2S3]WHY16858.1 hypothetical protein QNH28_15085 [Paenibacillus sp. G2S3]
MKNNQNSAVQNIHLLQSILSISEGHARLVGTWSLITERLLKEVSNTRYTTQMLQASQSIIQVMKTLLLFRLTLLANWNMVQCRIDKETELLLTQNNTLKSKFTETVWQLEEAYSELTSSILELHVKLLDRCYFREEQEERTKVFRQISFCLDIIRQWRMLNEPSKDVLLLIHSGLIPGNASRKQQISEVCSQEYLKVILEDMEHKPLIDRKLQVHISRLIQQIKSNYTQTISMTYAPNTVAPRNPVFFAAMTSTNTKQEPEWTQIEYNTLSKVQPPGKLWINKGLKSLEEF